MKKGLIVYATVSGNTEIVCQQVASDLSSVATVELINCNIVSDEQILAADFLILACGTYAHGLLQRYMESFVKKHANLDLAQKPCAAIGLGDSKYDHLYNMEAAVLLSKFLKDKNGHEVIDPLKINFSPVNQLDSTVSDWANLLADKLK